MASFADSDMLPYAPRIDAAPFGYDSFTTGQLLDDQLAYMSEQLQRDIRIVRPKPFVSNLTEHDTAVHASRLPVESGLNSVVISRRRAYGKGGLESAGLRIPAEKGLGDGSLVWVNTPPDGINSEFGRGVIEAKLAHELWHSVGIGHCATKNCLMSERLNTEAFYRLSVLPHKGLCHDHLVAIGGIARDKQYFARLRQQSQSATL
jgi:hypothetical protein